MLKTSGHASALVPILIAALGALACGSDTTGPSAPETIVLSTTSITLTAIEATNLISAIVKDARGNAVQDVSVSWSSSNESIATVSGGLVTAVATGSTIITATSGRLTATATVNVDQKPATVTLSRTTLTFTAVGDTATLTAIVRDANAHPIAAPGITWLSSDSTIATVTANGLVTARRGGTADITARSAAAVGVSRVTLTQQPTGVVIEGPATRTVAVADQDTLSARVVDASGNLIPNPALVWTSSDQSIARISTTGVVSAARAGSVTITASIAGILGNAAATSTSAAVLIQVTTTKAESVPTYLSTLAPGVQWEIPVVIIRYLPTNDGTLLNVQNAGISGTLSSVKKRVEVFEERIKFMLEEGARFRGYKTATSPSLGYRVLHIVTVYEPFKRGREVPWNLGHFFPDYHDVLNRIDARTWVNSKGVKEFWVWGYHNDEFEQPESNMSSPVTGDISNSSRFADDLPVFDKTYTVYGYNYARTQAEAVHNHGHQLEALLGYIDRGLFWKEFVGRDAADTRFVTGRAGWTHMPPNTTKEYEYRDPTVVQSDIADWKPGGGQQAPVSFTTWASVSYPWPASRAPGESAIAQQDESQWYMYWMQNMPGRNNTIPHGIGTMTNWWRFTGDWDGAIRDGVKLSTITTSPITIRNDYVGSILLEPGGTVAPGQSITISASEPTTVRVYDCGEAPQCIMDPYVLQPGKRYRVISHPQGPPTNLTIVEQ